MRRFPPLVLALFALCAFPAPGKGAVPSPATMASNAKAPPRTNTTAALAIASSNTGVSAPASVTAVGAQAGSRVPGRWYTNGMVISDISFETLSNQGLVFFENLSPSNAATNLPVDNKALLLMLTRNGDAPILRALAAALEILPPPATNASASNALSASEAQSNEILRRRIFDRLVPVAAPGASLSAIPLSEQRVTTGGALLRRADVLESLEVTAGDRTERLVRVRGQVDALVSGISIRASAVTLNTETRDLVAEGDIQLTGQGLTMRGERLWINLSNQKGAIFGAKGMLEGFQFHGQVFKINGPDHFSIEQAQVTTETNARPHFSIHVANFINPRKNAYYLGGISFFIHNAPFFWFPFVFQDPIGTSITFATGRTAREGFYLLNSINLGVPVLGILGVKANFFEKLGSYASVQNAGGATGHQWQFKVAVAEYFENEYINDASTLLNTTFVGSQLERKARFRYKIDLNDTLDLMPPGQAPVGVSSRLVSSLSLPSDPFFSHNLEGALPAFDIFNSLRNQVVENRYVPSPNDRQGLAFAYSLAAPNMSISVGATWAWLNYENLSVINPYDPKRWESHLSTIQAPDIQLQLSGAIDPPTTNITARTPANIGYSISAGYRLIDYYNATNFLFQYHNNQMNLKGSLSRPIAITKSPKNKDLRFLDININPSLSGEFNKTWGGEELGFDYVRANDRASRGILRASTGIGVNFPSTVARNEWNAAWDYRSMLPLLTLGLNWNLQYEAPLALQDSIPSLSNVTAHGLGASVSFSQKGYGLFYIPFLDIGHQFNVGFNYDLTPAFDTVTGALQDFSWSTNRVQSFEGNYQVGLTWKDRVKLNWTLPFSFYDRTTKSFLAQIRNQTWSLSWGWNPGTNLSRSRLFRLESIQTGLGWTIYSEPATQFQDALSFNFSMRATFFRFFDLTFSMGSLNSSPWRYFPDKAAAYGVTNVNFFSDLADSMGFNGLAGQQRGLFKMTAINLALTHDLDSWYLRLNYSLAPVPLADNGAVRGYYFDQRISLEINLKQEYRPKGFNTSLPSWQETFIPPALRQQGR